MPRNNPRRYARHRSAKPMQNARPNGANTQHQGSMNKANSKKSTKRTTREAKKKLKGQGDQGNSPAEVTHDDEHDEPFKVYWARWIMLMYISMLNLIVSLECLFLAANDGIAHIMFFIYSLVGLDLLFSCSYCSADLRSLWRN